MTSASIVTVAWRGVTFSGAHDGSPFGVTSLQGWDERPDVRIEWPTRPAGHGTFSGGVWSQDRIVTLGGQFIDRARRDELLVELEAAMGPGFDELTITKAGRTLTARAVVTAYRPDTSSQWGMGAVPYAIEWRCPDPLRYAALRSAVTGFPEQAGGLEYPLYTDGDGTVTGWLDYGEPSSTGRVVLENPGTADTWPQFEVTGPVPSDGFEILTVGTGRRLRFEGGVPAGSLLVLDAATGSVVIDGVADRGGLLTWRDWAPVPAGGSAEFAFIPLGSASAATLRASIRPAYW